MSTTSVLPDGVRLYKLAAGGNDFLVADARTLSDWDWGADRVRLACRRHLGLGADGFVTLLRPAAPGAHARFVLRNCDGSAASFSGNGARCATWLLHALGASDAGRVVLETDHGRVEARVAASAEDELPRVEVAIGEPRDVASSIRLPPGSPAPRGDYAIVGVPYLAVPVASVDELDIEAAGPPLRRWKALPEGANVAFYEPPQEPGRPVRLRTFERGVEGETLSSGTGCAIVALALALRADVRDGEVVHAFATRSHAPLSVRATVADGHVTGLLLVGDARLVGEVVPLAHALAPEP